MKMLSQMKSLDMAINENIYAALITGRASLGLLAVTCIITCAPAVPGHCRHGDMESAEGILNVMRKNGIFPTAISYTALMCGHADRGDMDGVEKVGFI